MTYDPRHGVPASWGGRVISSARQEVDIELDLYPDELKHVTVPGMTYPLITHGFFSVAPIPNIGQFQVAYQYMLKHGSRPWSKGAIITPPDCGLWMKISEHREEMADSGIIEVTSDGTDLFPFACTFMHNFQARRREGRRNLEAFMRGGSGDGSCPSPDWPMPAR